MEAIRNCNKCRGTNGLDGWQRVLVVGERISLHEICAAGADLSVEDIQQLLHAIGPGDLDLAAGRQVRVIDHDLLADLERCVASLRRGDEMPPAVGSGTGAVVELDFAGQP
jgi:hypothetical protein